MPTDLRTATEPPQHLLGGLAVAIFVAPGCRREQVLATKSALEELGVTVTLLGEGPVEALQVVASADPELFDAAVVPGGGDAAERLCRRDEVLAFMRRLHEEDKPLAALDEGVLVLVAACPRAGRSVVASPDLAGSVRAAGGEVATGPVQRDAHWLTATGDAALLQFQAGLKQLLALRRLEGFATAADDLPGAMGEDG